MTALVAFSKLKQVAYFRVFLFLVISFLNSFSLGADQTRKKVFVTAFEPFGGADVNFSEVVAETVRTQLSQKNIDVEICLLPVVYDRAAEKAKECFSQIQPPPDMAFSFGEGNCSIRMETAAHNRDSTPGFPDNDGQIRVQQKIMPQEEDTIAFRNHVVEMYCSTARLQRSEVHVSESPGGYVCNNTAFHLGHFFKKLNIPYSFIHVPANSCGSEVIAKNAGQTIAKMIGNTAQMTGTAGKEPLLNRYCTKLPTGIEDIQDLLAKLKKDSGKENKKACEREFLNRLKKRIEQWGTGKGLTY